MVRLKRVLNESEVAAELALVELRWLCRRYSACEPVALSPRQGAELVNKIMDESREARKPTG